MSDKGQYIPAEGFLLCKPLKEQTSEHLIIQDEGFDQEAEVLAVGSDTFYPYTSIVFKAPAKVGDKILHSSIGFENFRANGVKYRMVKFSSVMGVKK